MTDEQKAIIELRASLGLALGALMAIACSPNAFNVEGIKDVITRIEKTLENK